MTSPAHADPETSVVFVRAGVEVARTKMPGHLLEINLPKSVDLRRSPGGEIHLVESLDPLLECCGQIALPWVNRHGPGLSVLDVPPPAPFNAADLITMWQARNRLTARRRPHTSGSVAWSRLERVLGNDVDWGTMEDAVRVAAKTLAAWPVRAIPAVTWAPVDRAGGRLLVGLTERSTRSHRLQSGHQGVPSITARRSTLPEVRTLHALTAVAALLAERLADVPGLDQEPELRERLIGLFRQVGAKSNPTRPLADPPPSAWPAPLRATYIACLRALTTVLDLGPGDQHAPLAEVWELYQAWVAETVRNALDTVLAGALRTAPRGSCIGRWADGSGVVELHYQPRIPATGALQILGSRYSAAVGNLEPDLFLVRMDASATAAIVLDAKKRSSLMTRDDLTSNASKYLWGIRLTAAPQQVPVISGAVMVSPLGGPVSALDEGLADVLRGDLGGWC